MKGSFFKKRLRAFFVFIHACYLSQLLINFFIDICVVLFS
ncbi:hypothetical protein BN132_3808 [Cronobacter turicensis 564]|nr:hypothetical protein BN132_3808 [Cronobacter turicensis 564]